MQKLFQFFLLQEATKDTPTIEYIYIYIYIYINFYREYLLCLQSNASGSFCKHILIL